MTNFSVYPNKKLNEKQRKFHDELHKLKTQRDKEMEPIVLPQPFMGREFAEDAIDPVTKLPITMPTGRGEASKEKETKEQEQQDADFVLPIAEEP
jgi:hypothetical protein